MSGVQAPLALIELGQSTLERTNMSELVSWATRGRVAVITVNNPPVNALSPGVPEGIVDGIEAANADAGVDAIVLIGAGRGFIAGADIKHLGKPRSEKAGRVHDVLEGSAKPVVAAIHGHALGGGLRSRSNATIALL